MRKISQTKVAEIIQASELAHSFTEDGLSPDEALAKAASEYDFAPDHIKMMVRAYNTGKVNVHRKSASTVFERAADIPLANAKNILKLLYLTEKKSTQETLSQEVISTDYQRDPIHLNKAYEKAARANAHTELLPLPGAPPLPKEDRQLTKRAFDLADDLDKEVANYRGRVLEATDKLAHCLEKLDDYFSTGASLSLSGVKKAFIALYGEPGRQLVERVAVHPGRLSKSARVETGVLYDPSREPFKTLEEALSLVREVRQRKEAADLLSKESNKMAELLSKATGLRPDKYPPFTGSVFAQLELSKQAADTPGATDVNVKPIKTNWLNALTGGQAGAVSSAMQSSMDPEALREKAYNKLSDPLHEVKLDKVRSKAVLTDLMANDPVIASYHPEQVIKIYNELSQTAPVVTRTPVVLRAFLRKHLAQGQLDTHDFDQLAGIEGKLRGSKPEPKPQ